MVNFVDGGPRRVSVRRLYHSVAIAVRRNFWSRRSYVSVILRLLTTLPIVIFQPLHRISFAPRGRDALVLALFTKLLHVHILVGD